MLRWHAKVEELQSATARVAKISNRIEITEPSLLPLPGFGGKPMTDVRLRCILAVGVSIALTGCAAFDTSHYAWPGPGRSTVVTVDAKQRHLVMASDPDGKNFRACAEPAPDAFSAFGSSFSFKGLFGATSNDAQAANAFATTAATIERTQTVNLLRESFFRTCERYLNGYIDREEFALLAARDHRSMVAVLAIEQLTGVVKPESTVISGPAVQSLVSNTSELVSLLATYQAERAASEKALDEARNSLAEVDKPVTINGNSVQACSIDTRPDDAAAAAAYDLCAPKKLKVASAEEKLARAVENEKGVRQNIASLAGGLSAASQTGQSNFGGVDSSDRLDEVALIQLSKTVENIALTAGVDEGLMFCIGYLAREDTEPTTREMCNELIMRKQELDNQLIGSSYMLDFSPEEGRWVSQKATSYTSFRLRILDVMRATPDEEFEARFNAFLSRSGLKRPCSGKSNCIRAFTMGTPGALEFTQAPQPLNDALARWEEPEESE